MQHPYLSDFFEGDEPEYQSEEMDFSFETDPNISLGILKRKILEEINYYR